jgi:hypothetical protein
MKINGKVSWEPKDAFGDDVKEFEKKWGEIMQTHGERLAGASVLGRIRAPHARRRQEQKREI